MRAPIAVPPASSAATEHIGVDVMYPGRGRPAAAIPAAPVPDNPARVFAATAPTPEAEVARCCAPAEQAACCAPVAKAACCGDGSSGGCGCR